MKNLTRTYLVALTIIALVVSLSQFLVQNSITNSSADSRIINVSGRQRMLSQKITKASLAMTNASEQSFFDMRKNELQGAFDLLKKSHNALQFGSEEMKMPNIENSDAIKDLFAQIAPYYDELEAGVTEILKAQSVSETNSSEYLLALNTVLANEATFLKLMNDITFQYDAEALEKVKTLSFTEYILYGVALLLLLLEAILIFRPAIKKIDESTAELKKALSQSQYLTNQAESIFENVTQGIFMLDEQLNIDSFYSKQTEEIFEVDDLSNSNFLKLMKSRLMPQDLEALKLFAENLFNSDIREDVVNKLNPVEQVEIYTKTDTVDMHNRFIKISFARIIRDNKIYRILVTVLDETENILMKRQIEEAEERNQKESTQLLAILKVNPKMLKDYIDNSLLSLKTISTKYESHKASDYSDLISYTFRTLHTAKGNASLIGLDLIEDKLHALEDIVINLRNKTNVEGKDFLKIIYEVTEVIAILTNMKQMLMKIAVVYQQMATGTASDTSNAVLISTLNKGVEKLSEEVDKPVEFSFEENGVVLPDEYKVSVKDISIQLIRNSFIHGIEAEDDRQFAGKEAQANIKISLQKKAGFIDFTFEDDGKGLDSKKIAKKAIDLGLVSSDAVDLMTESEKLNLIFLEGFSTADKVDTNAGRGQGMDIIQKLAEKLGGKLQIDSAKGKYFKLVLSFPKEPKSELKQAG
ncbi:MAG: type IV pili methyl-accepting chemotaxis transducer N-terminal domain-containing protein [Cyclobacteriaceae bacterium]